MIEIRPFRLEDIEQAVSFAREQDQLTAAILEVDPREVLQKHYIAGDEMYSGLKNGQLIAVWGFHTNGLLSSSVYVWMLSTIEVEHAPREFAKETRRQMLSLLERFPTIIGNCLASHKRSIRWLSWLGAEFLSPIQIGETELIPFTIRRN